MEQGVRIMVQTPGGVYGQRGPENGSDPWRSLWTDNGPDPWRSLWTKESETLEEFQALLTRVNELGEAAHRLTVVRGHVLSTSFVFLSIHVMDSRVMPRRRGTSLLRLRIFSCNSDMPMF